ncbi:MAG: sulfite exporter TauE/SafE family protein [Aquificota bacterium]|jgi:uncharacterized membrane protein YfcA
MEYLVVATVSAITSFIFALGGLGSAIILVPILNLIGVPFPLARSTGLFTNVISSGGLLFNNLKNRRLDWKFALSLTGGAFIFSPIGAVVSHYVPQKWIGLLLSLFLIYASIAMYIPKKEGEYKERPLWVPILIGSVVGFISGMLGVGGGSIASPLLMLLGYPPTLIISSIPLMVFFSSLGGFLAYWKMGAVDWLLILSAALPAFFAGYLGAYVAHNFLSTKQIKKVLGLVFFVVGVRFLLKWL